MPVTREDTQHHAVPSKLNASDLDELGDFELAEELDSGTGPPPGPNRRLKTAGKLVNREVRGLHAGKIPGR